MNVLIHTLSPLSHGAFDVVDAGNASMLRKEPVVSLPGAPLVPCISGNSLRGQMRRVVMRDLLGRAALGPHSGMKPKSWDMLYGALANGGHLTGSEKSPSPEEIRRVREALPPLSLFGSALYRWLLQGRMRVSWLWPRCTETVAGGLVSDSGPVVDAGDLITEVGMVRHIEREHQSPEVTGVTPMPVTIEAIATGTVLETGIRFSSSATEVERAVAAWALDQIDVLGGKSAGGMGHVRIEHTGDATAYTDWLAATSPEDLRDRLVALAESIT